MKQDDRKITRDGIKIHHGIDYDGMRKSCVLAAETLDMIGDYVVPGVTTEELDDICHNFMISNGAVPATLGYRGYPKSSCISLNHVVCHGIPSNKKLKDGDILNIDITCVLDGWFGDSSRMFIAGKANRRSQRLIQVTHDALMLGIEQVKPGNTFGDIGAAIQRYVEAQRMAVVRDFCGHGIGRVFHAQPNDLHYGNWGEGSYLEEGMFFTIEPMVNLGRAETKILSDNWTAVTRDKSLSAQFEHSIAVTKEGYEIFTLSPKGKFFPNF